MYGRYYLDDETAKEIERLVRRLDERLRLQPAKSNRDILPSQNTESPNVPRSVTVCRTGDASFRLPATTNGTPKKKK